MIHGVAEEILAVVAALEELVEDHPQLFPLEERAGQEIEFSEGNALEGADILLGDKFVEIVPDQRPLVLAAQLIGIGLHL